MSDTPVPSVVQPAAVLRRLIARQAMPLGLIALCIWLLHEQAAGLDLSRILQATRAIPVGAWVSAVLAMLVSFWAVGRYDAVIHRLLATGVRCDDARRAGVAAIATGQTTGFGLLVGTLTRWRMLPQLSLWQAARVTVAVAASFLAGLAVLAAGLALWLGPAGPVPIWIAGTLVIGALAFGGCTLWRPRRLLRLALPPLRAQGAILALVGLDTLAAALCLYVLLPTGDLPPAMLFYAVFLLALGAGLVGATPGGLGPFEFVCLAFLPSVPEASLLAAIAGYRLVYFGIPGAIAAILLIIGPKSRYVKGSELQADLVRPESAQQIGSPLDRLLHDAQKAEAQLIRRGEFDLLSEDHTPVAMAAATGQSLILLGSPLSATYRPEKLVGLAAQIAQRKFLTPCLYKCPARIAVAARRAGWHVVPVASEAWLAPHHHDLDQPASRQLRRQLRKAKSAELRVVEGGAHLPLADMRAVAHGWDRRKGGARGFSMGVFDDAVLDRQKVFLCYDAERQLVAFVTFHQARREWSLDLTCQTRTCPPGAIHLLITAAIDAARLKGCPRLSLASTPLPLRRPFWIPSGLADRIERRRGAAGLIRFKSTFVPNWDRLYIAAPSRTGLFLSGIDLIDRITRVRHRQRRDKDK